MNKSEISALCADIRQNGLLNEIVVHDGMILDGRHRQIACDILGINCPSRKFAETCTPTEFVIA